MSISTKGVTISEKVVKSDHTQFYNVEVLGNLWVDGDLHATLPTGSSGSGGAGFDTVAVVEATNVSPLVAALTTSGYFTPGDGGGALYYRAAEEPTHGLFIQSLDGAFWIYGETDLRALAGGCTFDGATDDTAALNNCFKAAMYLGKRLILPPGTAIFTARLLFSATSLGITQYFSIVGAGYELTTLKRGSNYSSNVHLEFDRFAVGFSLSDFTIDCQASVYGQHGHGLVAWKSNHIRVSRVRVQDYTFNTGILIYADDTDVSDGIPIYYDCVTEDCITIGTADGSAGNGMSIVNLYKSGHINGISYNTFGSPGVGLQLKNNCNECFINGGLVDGALCGAGFGNSENVVGCINCSIQGPILRDCETGLTSGYAEHCDVNIPVCDINNRLAPGRAMDIQNSRSLSIYFGQILNFHAALYFNFGTYDCYAIVRELWQDDDTVHIPIVFATTTDRNYGVIGMYSQPIAVATVNVPNSGGPSNVCVYETGATDAVSALIPIGSTIVAAQAPDHLATGGNVRGYAAVDLQTQRTDAAQIAGGNYSVVLGGQNNEANASYSIAAGVNAFANALLSVAIGESVTADGQYSWALGNKTVTRATYGKIAFATGRFGTNGDAQIGFHVLRCSTTDNSLTRMTSDGLVAGLTNSIPLVDNSAFAISGRVIGFQQSTGTTKDWQFYTTIKRGVGVATTALITTPTPTVVNQDALAAAWALTIAADGVNGGLDVSVTGAIGAGIHWVGRIETTELQ